MKQTFEQHKNNSFQSKEFLEKVRKSEAVKPSLFKNQKVEVKDKEEEKIIRKNFEQSEKSEVKKYSKTKRILELEEEIKFEINKSQKYLEEITRLNSELDSCKLDLSEIEEKYVLREEYEFVKGELEYMCENYWN